MAGVQLLEASGTERQRLEKLGIGMPINELTDNQRKLKHIASLQNFNRHNPERPEWAHGAFVYVTVEHAVNIRAAIEEHGVQLQRRHLLVSSEYLGLVTNALRARPQDSSRDAYLFGRAGRTKVNAAVPAATFIHSAAASNIDGFVVRHTFLEPVSTSSDHSRRTRSTGDRPQTKSDVQSSLQLPGSEELPDRSADYGPRRKSFHLISLRDNTTTHTSISTHPIRVTRVGSIEQMIQCGVANVSVQHQYEASARGNSTVVLSTQVQGVSLQDATNVDVYMREHDDGASEEPCTTDLSINTEDFQKPLEDDVAFLEGLLSHRLDRYTSSVERGNLSSHLQEQAREFHGIIKDLFDTVPLVAADPAALEAALSALEDPKARFRAIHDVRIAFESRIRASLWALERSLQLHQIFSAAVQSDAFWHGVWRRLSKELKQRFKRDQIEAVMKAEASHQIELEVLKTDILFSLGQALTELFQHDILSKDHKKASYKLCKPWMRGSEEPLPDSESEMLPPTRRQRNRAELVAEDMERNCTRAYTWSGGRKGWSGGRWGHHVRAGAPPEMRGKMRHVANKLQGTSGPKRATGADFSKPLLCQHKIPIDFFLC